MVAALALFLFLHGALPWAQEAAPGRELVVPDVILSAEDPLYLPVPPSAGWTLQAPAQPDLDRRKLWAVDVPPLVRGLQAPPTVPSSAPFPGSAPRPAGGFPGELPATAPVETVPLPQHAESARRAAREVPVPGEAKLRLLYRTGTTAGIDLWLDRRRGDWEASGVAAMTVSGELPSWFEARAAAALERGTWRGSLEAEGEGILRQAGFLAGGLSVELERDPAPLGMGAVMRLRAEQPAEAGAAWLLLSQGISGSWQGPRMGTYLEALGLVAAAHSSQLHGLARAGLEWAGRVLTVSAGAALLASEDSLLPYPEAAAELRLAAPLRLQAGIAACLEEPAPFLVRAAFGDDARPGLLPAAGLAARFRAVLDAPRAGSFGISVQAFDGQRLQMRDGLLRRQDSFELSAEAVARLAVNAGDRWRPRLVLSAEGSAGIPLPLSARTFGQPLYAGLGGGLQVGFAKIPVELILQARWGDVPVAGLPALLAERQTAGGQASLTVRWEPRPRLAIDGGLELRVAEGFGGLAGCTLQARRSP